MFSSLKNDIPASIVVFFVALPLCLGIALASDAPPLAGIIAGIIGGIVVGAISGSHIGVSGPAAGLAAIVAAAIHSLGSFEAFLAAVVLAGVIQLVFGLLKLGIIGYFFPNSVIVGMLSGIGIIIMIKQIPHLIGLPNAIFKEISITDFLNRELWITITSEATLSVFYLGISGIFIMVFWDEILGKRHKFFKLVQGPLVAIVVATVLKLWWDNSQLQIPTEFLVQLPEISSLNALKGFIIFPDFSVINQQEVWIVAFALALVASLETLLSVEATDKIDPDKNTTPTNRELFAQGTGNILSGLVGGLPITQVIVRSSANVQSNGKTKLATILHGFLLVLAVLAFPKILNHVPNAVLAAILLLVGYKLAKPSLFKIMWQRGWTQFAPFAVTILIIVTTDLLKGIFAGLIIGVIVVLIKSYQNSLSVIKSTQTDGETFELHFADEISFLNKAAVQKNLNALPSLSHVVLDFKTTTYIDYDVVEILEDFATQSQNKNIDVTVHLRDKTIYNPTSYYRIFEDQHHKKME